MLQLVNTESRHDLAYQVPFVADRSQAPSFELRNRSDERLHGITLAMLGSGRLLWGVNSVLDPGDSVHFRVHGDDIARDSVLVVRWFRPSSDEYLWRMSF